MDKSVATRLSPFVNPLEPATRQLYVPRGDDSRDPWTRLQVARAGRNPRHCLLIGATGTGKSTELARLAEQRMAQEAAPLVALLRLQDQTTPEELSAPQVLFLLGVAALKAAGHEPPNERKNALQAAYRDVVVPVEGSNAEVNLTDVKERLGLALASAVKTAHPVAGGIMEGVARTARHLPLPGRGLKLGSNDAPVIRLADAVNACMAWTESVVGRPLELFVDGLDRLNLSSGREVFGTGVLSLPSSAVVYAAPYTVLLDEEGNSLEKHYDMLPVGNFPVFKRQPDGEHNPDGFASMRELVQLRLKAAGVHADQVFEGGLGTEGPVDQMIEASGGLPHQLVWIWDKAIRLGLVGANVARLRIGSVEIKAAIHELEERYVTRLRGSQISIVLETWRTQRKPEADGSDRLVFNNFVLAYPNGYPWFRPSPLLIPWLKEEFPNELLWLAGKREP